MGQCFGLQGERRQQASKGNKSFDYTPRRSWKHDDAHVMTQFKALSLESEGEGEDGGEFPVRTRALSSDSEEDLYTSQPRGTKGTSGHLVFSEEEEEELDDEEELETHSPHKTVLLNKGFQLLSDFSPTLSPRGNQSDQLQLIGDTDDYEDVT